jgi:heat-inducible transcriptional repressor
VAGKKGITEAIANEREQHFLKVLIERYISDGEPVGSKALSQDSQLALSTATIRNVMADLESLGLVTSPHTSAGRVPTVSGYRMFVDSLLTLKPLNSETVGQLKSGLGGVADKHHLVKSASEMLSGLTRMAGVVMVPRPNHATVRQIEFLPLSANRILTILVTSEGDVVNRVIETKKAYSPSELTQAANMLTSEYAGLGLEDIRKRLVSEMEDTRSSMNRIMAQALEMTSEVMEQNGSSDDYIMAGQTNLMGFDDLAEMDKLRELFDAFTEKHQLLHLLEKSMSADGVQIFIGHESGYQTMDKCSLITAPYNINGEMAGVLGVIGPTRMAYDRVIPIVDVTAKLLGAALKPKDL